MSDRDLTFESLSARFHELYGKAGEHSAAMAAWDRDLASLLARTPKDQIPSEFAALPDHSANATTAGEYFTRALATIGAMVGGAYLGGKK